jgi:hypothetical protein
MTTLIVILWVLCALGAYLIAKDKHYADGGHKGNRAFFAGLLCGLIGLIAVLFWKDDRPASTPR